MPIRIMLRKCEHCGHRYPYNPDTGNFGMICPACRKAQSERLPVLSLGKKK